MNEPTINLITKDWSPSHTRQYLRGTRNAWQRLRQRDTNPFFSMWNHLKQNMFSFASFRFRLISPAVCTGFGMSPIWRQKMICFALGKPLRACCTYQLETNFYHQLRTRCFLSWFTLRWHLNPFPFFFNPASSRVSVKRANRFYEKGSRFHLSLSQRITTDMSFGLSSSVEFQVDLIRLEYFRRYSCTARRLAFENIDGTVQVYRRRKERWYFRKFDTRHVAEK